MRMRMQVRFRVFPRDKESLFLRKRQSRLFHAAFPLLRIGIMLVRRAHEDYYLYVCVCVCVCIYILRSRGRVLVAMCVCVCILYTRSRCVSGRHCVELFLENLNLEKERK